MAKTTAPLLSFGAAGSVAKTAVYSRWRGIPYVRRYAIPANPRTNEQTLTRDIFRTMGQVWSYLPPEAQAPWTEFAKGRPFTNRNAFTGQNVKAIRPSPTDFEFFVGSPGAKGGVAPASVTPTPAATTITVAVVAPTIPEGWVLTAAQGICFEDVDPTLEFTEAVQFVEDTSSTYSLVFTGLTTATDYVVSVWLQWEKPNGDVAYSRSTTLQVTTS